MKKYPCFSVYLDTENGNLVFAGIGSSKKESIKTAKRLFPNITSFFTWSSKNSLKKAKYDFLYYLADLNIVGAEAKQISNLLAEIYKEFLKRSRNNEPPLAS